MAPLKLTAYHVCTQRASSTMYATVLELYGSFCSPSVVTEQQCLGTDKQQLELSLLSLPYIIIGALISDRNSSEPTFAQR